MAKQTPTASKSTAKSASDGSSSVFSFLKKSKSPPEGSPATNVSTTRETVESIVIAFVLAFLFRTFEAEAFVIPTGSMAPTLMGRHKDIPACPKCGYSYRASASNEVDDEFNRLQAKRNEIEQKLAAARTKLAASEDKPGEREQLLRAIDDLEHAQRFNQEDIGRKDIVSVTCPMCRHKLNVDPETPSGAQYLAYNGDRILVGKFAYDIAEPKRWDIVVFHFPGNAQINYIKRLVGLPGESIRIKHGDLFTHRDGQSFEIARKPPEKLQAMLHMVYDNDYVVDAMTEKGWPARWQPLAEDSREKSAWSSNDGSRSYVCDGKSPGERWLRYRHVYPTQADWDALEQHKLTREPKPKLITDFYAYNTHVPRGSDPETQALGLHWVGDLALACEVDVQSSNGVILLDLVEGGVHFRAAIDVATGESKLSCDALPDFHPTAKTNLRGPGKYELMFSNVDDQLLLWVNGSVIAFDVPTTYGPLDNQYPRSSSQDPGDLAPAGIGSQGVAMRASHLRVLRDIYYIAAASGVSISDYKAYDSVIPNLHRGDALAEFFATPAAWGEPGQSPFDDRGAIEFKMELGKTPDTDQFFVLGDNSPASADGRLWNDREPYVERNLLIGKALFIYWPHAWPTKYNIPIRAFGTEIRVPFWPNFRRMGFVK